MAVILKPVLNAIEKQNRSTRLRKKNRSAAKASGDLKKIRESDKTLVKTAKQKKEAYKRLQTAYEADKGRELVIKGKKKTSWIKDYKQQAGTMTAGVILGSSLAKYYNRKQAVLFVKGKGYIPMATIAGNAAIGAAFVTSTLIGMANQQRNKNIDAYNSESRRRL